MSFKNQSMNLPTVDKVPLLDVNRGNAPIQAEALKAIETIVEKGCFIGGQYCKDFEAAMARYCQTDYAIGCASGSDALLLSLMAIGIEPGDEVICPSFTFFATASAVWRLGATPVFADIDPISYNIDPKKIADCITDRTRAIIPVHLFGQCADMDAIQAAIGDRDIVIIEDAAQAIGATYKQRLAGSMSSYGCFSFYPTKNLGAFGDAGIITTNDRQLADNIRLYANHGMNPRYYHSVVGINSRLDAFQAAILKIKLGYLNFWTNDRRENAQRYREMFSDAQLGSRIELPVESEDCYHIYNQFTIRLFETDRDMLKQKLNERGIGSEIYYPVPLHQQACFESLGYQEGSLPETERASREVLSLPIFPELTEAEQATVVKGVAELLDTCRLPQRIAS